jgi:hypothetical protein
MRSRRQEGMTLHLCNQLHKYPHPGSRIRYPLSTCRARVAKSSSAVQDGNLIRIDGPTKPFWLSENSGSDEPPRKPIRAFRLEATRRIAMSAMTEGTSCKEHEIQEGPELLLEQRTAMRSSWLSSLSIQLS